MKGQDIGLHALERVNRSGMISGVPESDPWVESSVVFLCLGGSELAIKGSRSSRARVEATTTRLMIGQQDSSTRPRLTSTKVALLLREEILPIRSTFYMYG